MKSKYIYLIWFVALLPTMIFRDFTPNNELRYLDIVDEALKSGNIFTFTNQGEIYADKPPFYFWLMMIGKLILGEHRMWYYSLLSFIPAFVTIITMTKWIRREHGVEEKTAPLMLMTTGLFIGSTLVVRMDMLMIMFIVLSLYSFYQMYYGQNLKRNSFLFPIYVFFALFSKGPLGLLIPFVSTIMFLIFKKKLRDYKNYWGWKSLLIILVGCIVWFIGVYIEGGNEYLNNLLVHQTVGRGIDSFHHKEPFYYYGISIWYSLAPWSLLFVPIFIAALIKKRINSVLEQYFAVIIMSTFVLLSLISSKIAIYSLPLIPFSIYITALLFNKFNIQNIWIKLAIAFPAFIFIFALPAVIYLSKTEEMLFLQNWFIYIGAGVLSITGIIIIYFLYRKKDTFRSINTMAIGFLIGIFIIGWSMPQLNDQLGWGNLCKKAIELADKHQIEDYQVYNIKRSENMDVYLGKDIIKVDKEKILRGAQDNRLLILPNKDISIDNEINSILSDKEHYQIGKYTIVIFK
ncbi:MAG: dolichyl-phosphate-mannose--protein mannosyltransferase [Dysgonamonadaceae bacterium]|jgi:4-amino-4-deoxy-L-arabinose transferase-like glycosyltransferase|nr:dolichyl-phosphate-mannose--protein mannosyltransferase [Dysgonamonadaceae bacterium]MDD3308417.1 dolichyl-phosphate-mannose--protein mannosyltransferase [Dysgonamonadaceae bacterium]MDD3900161.1 dolichyl-phosphate-mannose--protein mannosyltransferase [Dysgonamonadaceae bacterium]MDD4398909.1 dolichyl-phosphate-mannose--protein mannosyltransferase [Dysgonamonadaceae bacterium]MEA5081034.1 dolichyl-phosphate-mannose--protein mannosyltransferase [Dysgonamonadaceae bacterium]